MNRYLFVLGLVLLSIYPNSAAWGQGAYGERQFYNQLNSVHNQVRPHFKQARQYMGQLRQQGVNTSGWERQLNWVESQLKGMRWTGGTSGRGGTGFQTINPFGDYLFHGVPIRPQDGKLVTRQWDPNGLAARAEEWAKELLSMTDKDGQEAQSVAAASVQALRARTADIDGKIARITDLYVLQDIDRDAYLERKRSLMSERKSVEEQIALLERNASAWLEPMRKWIQDAQMLGEILKTDDLPSKKTSLQKIFGSNLTLQAREARGVPMNPWFFLDEEKQKLGKIPLSSILVCIRVSARTYFSRNC